MNLPVRFSMGTILGAMFMGLGIVTAGAAASLTDQAGAASTDQAVQAAVFFPATMTVNEGDTVTWTIGSELVHTVTFGTPPFPLPDNRVFARMGGPIYDGTTFVNSGTITPAGAPGSKFALTFTKSGTYAYFCFLHPTMKGKVVVQAAGSAYPAAQATYKAADDPVMVALLKDGAAAAAATKATSKANGDGSKTYSMNAGTGDGKSYMVERFGVGSLSINVGDSVTWTTGDPNEPHTVTFLDNGKDIPTFMPDGTENPAVGTPAGGKTYDGKGLTNSGVLAPAGLPPQAGPNSFTLKFTTPGDFEYQCLLHDNLGMKATIKVAAMPQLPKTGGTPGFVGLGLGVASLALIGGGSAFVVETRPEPDSGRKGQAFLTRPWRRDG